ncbi:MAG: isoleucine--tRNA ligase [bacterium]
MSDIHTPAKPVAKAPEPSAYFRIEQDMIDYWKKHKIFERSVEERPADKPWTFLDGPPFVTGLPHYGHIVGSVVKDVFPRFKTMQGYRVRRVWGWDGHGLPIENKVENAMGLKSKKEIENKVGVGPFIEKCKEYVQEVSSEWEWYIDHIGRWADFKNAYRTWDKEYMESVMWVFKQLYEKNHIYKGLRVSLFCPHCSTPISNFEVAMDAGENYKDVTEPANTYKYKLVESPKVHKVESQKSKGTYFLAWSTTPWTKLTTTALAVNPDLVYVCVEHDGERFILAQSTLEAVFKQKGVDLSTLNVVWEKQGSELLGMTYEGHFDFYKRVEGKRQHVIVADTFVTATEGTGIVTIAPYGEEDLKVMTRDSIQIVRNVDDEGKLTPDNPNGWAGVYYLKVNKLVNQDLTDRGLMFHEEPGHSHSVAHCWRCHERLFFNPQEAWYVNIQNLKTVMKETNESVNWYPDHFKYGRFLKSMESAPDWCISRSRYWGSPVPVWEYTHADGQVERFVPGSIAELSEASGMKLDDLHKPVIDTVLIPSKIDPTKKLRRVSEVLDSWIEAGSASFAERHFPFNPDAKLEDFFPPDFISEYTGQIRAWFYVLHVISAGIYGRPAFKNVSVTGVIMGSDGRKMSKNYKNYPDPREVIEKYGGDALRLYLLGSPITKGEDINISEQEYRDQLRKFIIPLLNIWNFYEMYAGVDGYDQFKIQNVKGKNDPSPKGHGIQSENVLDKWLVSKLHSTVQAVSEALEQYDTVVTVALISEFVDDWSKWHVRRSRDRAGSGDLTPDARAYYDTTTEVFEVFLRLIAPVVPFHSEYLYRKLTGRESVHLESWPHVETSSIDTELETNTVIARSLCEAGHNIRKTNSWKVRQPLASLDIQTEGDTSTFSDALWQVVLDELNIKNIQISGAQAYPATPVVVTEAQLAREGKIRDVLREVQALRKDAKIGIADQVALEIPPEYVEFADQIRLYGRVNALTVGTSLKVLSS